MIPSVAADEQVSTAPKRERAAHLERTAYEAPQTPMEHHVATLVTHLRDGRDSQGGFAQKIEAALDHAFHLEKQVARLSRENRELEDRIALSLPRIVFGAEVQKRRQAGPPSPSDLIDMRFTWRMEQLAWAAHLNRDPKEPRHDRERYLRRLRWVALRDLCRELRKQVDKAFRDNGLVPCQP